jgi:bacterioferritin
LHRLEAFDSNRRSTVAAFRLNIEKIRQRAREKMMAGPVTEAYGLSPEEVCSVLDEVLATELVCVLRYKSHYYAATGIKGETVAKELHDHALEEQDHADQIAERITQLGGVPNLDPKGLADRSHSEFHRGGDLREMLREDLVAERIAIETYSEVVRWLGDKDPTTRRLMESILEKEEEHADDLRGLLEHMEI